ncbi:MAG TPA: TonB-dependent receptor, partial [Verrucomicrobiae bacterium]
QPGGQTSVFLRGANNSHTLVLIDGVRVNNGFNNAFDFNNLSVDNVERIEILRGPQSTLYGSEALGGVINIVTRRGAERFSGSATAEYGSHNSLLTRGSVAATEGKFSFSAEGGYASGDNERINSDYANRNFSGRATFRTSDAFSASFLANYLRSDAGSPNDRFTDDPNDRLRNENRLLALTLDGRPLDWWDAKLTLSHAREHAFFNQPEPNPPFPPSGFGNYTSDLVARREQADFQNIFTLADGHQFLAGGTFEQSEAEFTDTYSALDRTVVTRSGYAQYEFTPTRRLTVTAGGRVDDSSSFGTHGTYRFGGRFTTPGTETILRASAGTGFRAPSIRELYYPFFGNPNLRPEESFGWDAGVEQPLAENRVRVGVTFFHNDFDDLINGFPPANVARARTLGLESFASWSPVTNLTLRAVHTWLDAEDRATGLRLDRRPEHSASFSANWQFPERFSASTVVKIVGSRPDKNYFTANFPPYAVTPVINPGYVKWDLAMKYDVCRNFSLFGRVENLLDQHYEEVFGFPALGRIFVIGGSAKF